MPGASWAGLPVLRLSRSFFIFRLVAQPAPPGCRHLQGL